jgi:hypothetical protein
MANVHNISEELMQVAPAVANLDRNNPYAVPMGYFDGLAEIILERVVDMQLPGENISISKHPSYSIPDGYFEGLANTILAKIYSEKQLQNTEVFNELAHVAPLLNTINKQNVFSIPDGYFSGLHINLPAESKGAKVIVFGGNIKKWATYAAAASVLFIVSATSYLYVNQHLKHTGKLTIEQRLATLKDEEILNYLKNDLGDFDFNTATPAEEDPDINHLLINASDAEIERYLDTESGSGEEIIKGI